MVVESYVLNWAIPSGWELDPETGYVWQIGPGGNPRKMLLEEAVARALLTQLHPIRSHITVATERMMGKPSWRMNPAVAYLLMPVKSEDVHVVRLELDGSVSLFGWPLERDPTRPPAHGDPHTWSQGAHPYVELGWTVTSGPTDGN